METFSRRAVEPDGALRVVNAYLVLGAESSGTRLMSRLLIASGCDGSPEHDQPFDHALPPASQRAIVWRRSVPHAGEWIDIPAWAEKTREAGYEPRAIMMSRDWFAVSCSQVEIGHAANSIEAIDHIRRAYQHIIDGVMAANMPYVVVNYESLMQRQRRVMMWVLETLGWPFESVAVRDENAKWYGETWQL